MKFVKSLLGCGLLCMATVQTLSAATPPQNTKKTNQKGSKKTAKKIDFTKDYKVTEKVFFEGQDAEFIITLGKISDKDTEVTFRLINETADNSDYQVPQTLTTIVPAGQKVKKFYIPLTIDNIQEEDERFGLQLVKVRGYKVRRSRVNITIKDFNLSSDYKNTSDNQNHVNVTPNPVEDFTTLNIDNFKGKKQRTLVTILSPEGVLAYKGKHKIENGEIQLDLTSLPSGVYMVNLSGIEHDNIKLIKN